MIEPKNIKDLKWHLIDEGDFPPNDKYILLSFENFSLCLVGRCEGNEDDGYLFFVGDDETPCIEQDIFVNAWMPIPERIET